MQKNLDNKTVRKILAQNTFLSEKMKELVEENRKLQSKIIQIQSILNPETKLDI
jgi:hypothetical protein